MLKEVVDLQRIDPKEDSKYFALMTRLTSSAGTPIIFDSCLRGDVL